MLVVGSVVVLVMRPGVRARIALWTQRLLDKEF